MKTEQAKQLTQDALDELTGALKAGRSEALTAYLRAMSHFHQYSFGNIMLIWSQKPDATRVAGFRTWKKLNRYVRKGEKGIAIIAPMLVRAKQDDEAAERSDDDNEKMLRFRVVYVFDVSQTDGEPLPEFEKVSGDPGEHTERLEAFVRGRGITIEYADDLNGAHGVSRGGSITLLRDLTTAEHFAVLVHELAHEMLHRDPETRPKSRTVRETEAEAVAFVVSAAIGLETGTAASDYIQLYQGDAETLAASLDRIQRSSAEIIEALTASDDDDTTADLQPACEAREEVRP